MPPRPPLLEPGRPIRAETLRVLRARIQQSVRKITDHRLTPIRRRLTVHRIQRRTQQRILPRRHRPRQRILNDRRYQRLLPRRHRPRFRVRVLTARGDSGVHRIDTRPRPTHLEHHRRRAKIPRDLRVFTLTRLAFLIEHHHLPIRDHLPRRELRLTQRRLPRPNVRDDHHQTRGDTRIPLYAVLRELVDNHDLFADLIQPARDTGTAARDRVTAVFNASACRVVDHCPDGRASYHPNLSSHRRRDADIRSAPGDPAAAAMPNR